MMKKLYFSPAVAARYIGDDGKDFAASLARPKPILNHGDIVITDKRTAYNLINKGFGQYESVESIEIPDVDELISENKHLKNECERLKSELAIALGFLSVDDTVNTDEVPPIDGTVNIDEVPPIDGTVNTDEVPPVDETANTDEVPPVNETVKQEISRGKNHRKLNP